jgi:hypothetical protein
MIPTQLGPTMRSRLGFAASSIACGSARPNSPLPPKPVVMTMDARVPRWLSSLIRGATISGGGDDGQLQGSRQACDVCIDAHAIDSAGMRVDQRQIRRQRRRGRGCARPPRRPSQAAKLPRLGLPIADRWFAHRGAFCRPGEKPGPTSTVDTGCRRCDKIFRSLLNCMSDAGLSILQPMVVRYMTACCTCCGSAAGARLLVERSEMRRDRRLT